MSNTPDSPNRCVIIVDDAYLLRSIASARRRVVFLAPGVSGAVAQALSAAWSKLGPNMVSVILDVDPEVCRLGYGSEDGLNTLQDTARKLGQTLCHEPGTRVGLLIVDDLTIVYSPTPLLIEAQPTSDSASSQISLVPSPLRPNAVVFGEPSAQLASELGIGPSGAETRSLGLDAVKPEGLAQLHADLSRNPPLKFDIARYERVFNARIEFVELTVEGCAVSRHTASIPSDLLVLAEDAATGRRLRSTFRVIGEEDAVDDLGKLSERALDDERKRITDDYLITLPNYGTVILRTNRPAFEKEIETLRGKVTAYGEGLKTRLDTIIEANVSKLLKTLLPRVVKSPPPRWKRFVGASPTPEQCRVPVGTGARERLWLFGRVGPRNEGKPAVQRRDLSDARRS